MTDFSGRSAIESNRDSAALRGVAAVACVRAKERDSKTSLPDLAPATRVRRYGATKPGPEAKLMRALTTWVLHSNEHDAQWAASGFPIATGEPDLLLVSCRPELRALRNMTPTHARVLAYLSEVSASQPTTIARRSGATVADVDHAVQDLVGVGAVNVLGRRVAIVPSWKTILHDTVAIEAKVSDWRRGAAQAARNRLFAQRSFLALPLRIAERISTDPLITARRIGVLGVDASRVTLVRDSARANPLIWFYYYSLAMAVASSLRRTNNGLRRADR